MTGYARFVVEFLDGSRVDIDDVADRKDARRVAVALARAKGWPSATVTRTWKYDRGKLVNPSPPRPRKPKDYTTEMFPAS